jgi:2',3'-cyclic-nucleotide 2'-phosphodiesterase (5'-nucleotidase family)
MAPNVVQLQKVRLTLNKTMQEFGKQVATLEKSLTRDPNPALTGGIKQVRQAVKAMNERVIETLDKALSESEPRKREALYDAAGKAAREFLKFVDADARIKSLADNPISPVPARAALTKVLTAMTRVLA